MRAFFGPFTLLAHLGPCGPLGNLRIFSGVSRDRDRPRSVSLERELGLDEELLAETGKTCLIFAALDRERQPTGIADQDDLLLSSGDGRVEQPTVSFKPILCR